MGWISQGASSSTPSTPSSRVDRSVDVQVEDAALRLRSLRLISRVIKIFALILIPSARLVGQAIYKWVFSTCWPPQFLISFRAGPLVARLRLPSHRACPQKSGFNGGRFRIAAAP